MLPKLDTFSKVDTVHPVFMLDSPEVLNTEAARTEDMLTSEFLNSIFMLLPSFYFTQSSRHVSETVRGNSTCFYFS